uniref:Uncharacterized protein n=1 Tax=Periophthalmus magnuspinnatus TaxID=409849 RepID=A0A3B4A9C9_9GOBI
MRRRPTLPSAHILALHIQQLEIGAFKLTTGAYKWNKLRIAKVVSQVHAFQEAVFPSSHTCGSGLHGWAPQTSTSWPQETRPTSNRPASAKHGEFTTHCGGSRPAFS